MIDNFVYQNKNNPFPVAESAPASGTPESAPAASGVSGDPHIKTWSGSKFDYMGECDLILAKSAMFGSGQGLEVQIRTTIRNDWSFTSAAALKIGSSILEVHSNGDYLLDGEKDVDLFSETLSGHRITWQNERINADLNFHLFTVHLGEGKKVYVEVKNNLLDVTFDNADESNFGDVVGLMGSFRDGKLLGRDGETIFSDYDLFGQEWQVQETEEMLFQDLGQGPQAPAKCNLPAVRKSLEERRNLRGGDNSEFVAKAEKACSAWPKDMREACMYDVLATGDLSMAIRVVF